MIGLVNLQPLVFHFILLLLPGLAHGALHIEGPGHNNGTNQKPYNEQRVFIQLMLGKYLYIC